MFIVTVIFLIFVWKYKQLLNEYNHQTNNIQKLCIERLENIATSFQFYSDTKEEKYLLHALKEIYFFTNIYASTDNTYYNVDIHSVMNQINIYLCQTESLDHQILDIFIEGVSLLSKDINNRNGYYKLLDFLDLISP